MHLLTVLGTLLVSQQQLALRQILPPLPTFHHWQRKNQRFVQRELSVTQTGPWKDWPQSLTLLKVNPELPSRTRVSGRRRSPQRLYFLQIQRQATFIHSHTQCLKSPMGQGTEIRNPP
ncbi:unnamed protein product [Thlaspi arvense]|uniref:Secreted protein n=1 Tax=Thlaspi arvense TaxID=13288 RepID=A0AAU9RE22_THLAR|nr:unnamed protein product [Thlaspi arvense]